MDVLENLPQVGYVERRRPRGRKGHVGSAAAMIRDRLSRADETLEGSKISRIHR
jgi:hypothetical protein